MLDARPEQRDPSLVLFVGLYLLLLAFFILLVTLSRYDDRRTEAVVGSVRSTFQSVLPVPQPGLLRDENDALDRGRAHQERVGQLVRGVLPLARFEVVTPGRLLLVRLPVDELFEPDSAVLRPEMRALWTRIAATLGGVEGQRYDLEMVLGRERTPLGGALGLDVERAGAFARAMAAFGAPRDAVAVGVAPGDPAELQLVFHVRPLAAMRLDLPAAAETPPRGAPAGVVAPGTAP